MTNEYFVNISYVKKKLEEYLSTIFKVYGNELVLKLEDYNLLQSEHNCIESSTATGFIMEEFITSKLEIYTSNHNETNEIKVHKISNSTVNSSYDCYVEYKNIFFMINIKVEKSRSNNNGVSAINILHYDYVECNADKDKAYLVLKTNYCFNKSSKDGERKIFIDKIYGYFLEQIDFSKGYQQDNRNWSSNFNGNSGRLQITQTILKNNQLKEKDISYERTKEFIHKIYLDNLLNLNKESTEDIE